MTPPCPRFAAPWHIMSRIPERSWLLFSAALLFGPTPPTRTQDAPHRRPSFPVKFPSRPTPSRPLEDLPYILSNQHYPIHSPLVHSFDTLPNHCLIRQINLHKRFTLSLMLSHHLHYL